MRTNGVALHRFDERRPCPKCEWSPVPPEFCAKKIHETYMGLGGSWLNEVIPEGDHFHRKCGRCGYKWVELAIGTPVMATRTHRRREQELRQQWIQQQREVVESMRGLPT